MNRIEYYFREISNIPRESKNEEAICDYVEVFAKTHGLSYVRDELHNIVVYKPAYPGYEDHPVTMLEGHMDMVCEKNEESSHNFEKDPIEWVIKDDFLYANKTTLGADDGVGVAYMLAILEDPNLKHPALECAFTVQEEIGLIGANFLKGEYFKAKYMIGLDAGEEKEVCVSCSGGRRVQVTKDVTYEMNSKPTYEIFVTGLLGGHSGEDINKERGNANKIMARIYYNLMKKNVEFKIASFQGGLKDNAIPRECRSTFASYAEKETIEGIIKSVESGIRSELAESDTGFEVHFAQVNTAFKVVSSKESKEIVQFLYLMPNGFMQKSMKIEGLTTISLNLGTTRLDNQFHAVSALRSPIVSAKENMSDHIELLASMFGAHYKLVSNYPGWQYEPNSELRRKYIDFVSESEGVELKETATHGGLETGIIKGIVPDIDIIAMGPDMFDIHTPNEHLNLKSFTLVFNRLVKFLETL